MHLLGGGKIFSVRGQVIRTSEVFHRLKIRGGTKSRISQEGWFYICQSEREEYQRHLSDQQSAFLNDHENDNCFSIKTILESMHCEQWIKSFILVITALN